ncbi:MAG TPA: murein biosynthesis integral membrane protein MurJ [Aliidongia sp.]|nr:murein biosynthesis integral membrane protein MurJ [Aliidongia sp.]
MTLFRAAATVGGFTMVSRVLGFVRDVMMAEVLGAGPVSDAFFVALRLPNMFRTLFAEGAFSAAFVPVFTRRLAADGSEGARRFAEQALSILVAALLLTVLLAEAFMPQLIPVIAPGFTDKPDQFALATALTRITFPYLLFISLASLQSGILNSLDRFAAAAITPALLNVFQIGGLIWSRRFGDATETLSWCVTAGGVAQFLWLAFSCARAGMALRLHWPRVTDEMRRLGRLMAPGIFGAGVTQINLLVSTSVASELAAGSISYLNWADRLNQLPLAIIGTAVGTAILPTLSRQLRGDDQSAAMETQNRGIEMALLLTIPAAVALMVIAGPIVWVLFRHGNFDAAAAAGTASALTAYAAGLPAFVLVKVLVPAFYARHDTRTPVRVGVVSLIVNIALIFALAGPFHHVGNAIATSVAGWINMLSLAWLLHRRRHLALDARSRRRLPRIAASAIAMALVLAGAAALAAPYIHAGGILLPYAALAVLVGLGLAAYAGFALLFGAGSLADLKRLVRRRRPAAANS